MDDDYLKQRAKETAQAIVAVYWPDRELLERAIAQLALAGLRCCGEAYMKECK
jgi:hypothetical protein